MGRRATWMVVLTLGLAVGGCGSGAKRNTTPAVLKDPRMVKGR